MTEEPSIINPMPKDVNYHLTNSENASKYSSKDGTEVDH